jgi:hypothetical protein
LRRFDSDKMETEPEIDVEKSLKDLKDLQYDVI